MDLAQDIYKKRDELQALINQATAAGYRVNMPRDTLAGLTVSETGKVAKDASPAPQPPEPPAETDASSGKSKLFSKKAE